jgi:tetratricopeptide (TPR) repeat protein
LQAHDFGGAADLLRGVLSEYPEERELHERVEQYLSICERKVAPPAAAPKTVEESLYAATLALNSGDYMSALSHVDSALGRAPDNDHAHFTRAVVLTLRGEVSEALPSLVRAVELNPENHALARQEPDLETLRQNAEARQTLDAITPRRRRRGGSRTRPSR